MRVHVVTLELRRPKRILNKFQQICSEELFENTEWKILKTRWCPQKMALSFGKYAESAKGFSLKLLPH